MKKANIINLIKYYSEKNDSGFRSESYEIAKEFNRAGDHKLAEYIMALLSEANTFVPQSLEYTSEILKKVNIINDPLPLPECITDDILGIINAVKKNIGINKFLFSGAPGTGKTETTKQIARILKRNLYMVNFDGLIDCKLGQTSKNIANLFVEINKLSKNEQAIVLFDEIDALALDRIDSKDIREMGRATSAVLKGFDNVDERAVIIATTNLVDRFDKALLRRFDHVVDFNRYSQEDLVKIANDLLEVWLGRVGIKARNKRLFTKILEEMPKIPYPGDLKNLLKSCVAFSTPDDDYDYLRRLYIIVNEKMDDVKVLREKGFTFREIELLANVSKSKAALAAKEN